MTRLIGIDHGVVRIGVAVSDPLRLVARELTIITRTSKREDFARLNTIAAEQKASAFVVGIPSDFDQRPGEYTQADKVRTWIDRFAETATLPIVQWDEQLTSVDAQELAKRLKRPRRAHVDDLAARLILQSYLDALRDGLAPAPPEPPAG